MDDIKKLLSIDTPRGFPTLQSNLIELPHSKCYPSAGMPALSRKILAVGAALLLSRPCAAVSVPDITASSSTVSKQKTEPIRYRFDRGTGPNGRPTIGVGAGIEEGKPLEMMIWGGGGAVAGSLAGPLGAAVGGAIGAAIGLLISIYAVPHNGPVNSTK